MDKKNLIIRLSFIIVIVSGLYIIFLLPAEKKETELPDTAGNKRKKRTSHFRDKDISAEWKSDNEMKRPENISPEVWERYMKIYEREKTNNVPIEFYGKITDQEGTPVPEVKISLRVFSKLKRYKKEIELFSDYEGLFSLTGVTGTSLHIEKLEKKGYVEGNRSGSFDYAKYKPIHNPDINNPVIIRMWRKGETEPLIREKTKIRVTGDNREFFTNLISGKTFSELTDKADLGIRMEIDKPVNNTPRYNWRIIIRAINGGLIETDDIFLYQAPKNGYRQSLDMFFDRTFRWSGDAYRKVYLKSRNGQIYAGLKLTIQAYRRGDGFIEIDSIINPNGSGNLEYDSAKRIRVRH